MEWIWQSHYLVIDKKTIFVIEQDLYKGRYDMPEISIKDGIVTGSLPRRALNLVYSWLDEHRDELLENWERLAKGEKAQKIKPLD